MPPTTPGEFGAAPSTPGVLGGVLLPRDELPVPFTTPGVEGVVCTGPITPTGVGGLLKEGLVMEGVLKEGPVTEGLLTDGLPVAPKAGLPVIPPVVPTEGLPVVPKEGLLVVPAAAAGLLEV